MFLQFGIFALFFLQTGICEFVVSFHTGRCDPFFFLQTGKAGKRVEMFGLLFGPSTIVSETERKEGGSEGCPSMRSFLRLPQAQQGGPRMCLPEMT